MRIHASRTHDLNSEALYNILCPGHGGTCKCGAPTKFVSLQKGYQRRCLPCAKKLGAEKAAVSRRANYRPAWNSGKTKKTDTSVAKAAHAIKKNIVERGGHWNKGRSKETHESIAIAAAKRSSTMKKSYASGERVAWHKGLTAKTDERLAAMGKLISEKMKTKHISHAGNDAAIDWRRNISHSRTGVSYDEVKAALVANNANIRFRYDLETYSGLTCTTHVECLKCGSMHEYTWQQLLEGRECSTCNPKPGWSAGLTRSDDERLAKLGDAVRRALQTRHISKCGDNERIQAWKDNISSARTIDVDSIRERLHARAYDFEWEESVVDDIRSVVQHFDVKCRQCGTVQQKTLVLLGRGSLCNNCYPPHTTSKWQEEVAYYVRSCGADVSVNDRSIIGPLELDVWVPSAKFGIECHGLYWHSEATDTDPEAHTEKWQRCNEAGIKLIQLFEDEWRDKQDLVKSMLRHRLGLSRRIYARKCVVRSLNAATARSFLEDNHIDGYTPSKHKFGLEFEDELVAVITTRVPFHRKWRDRGYIEIARMASKRDVQVVGGASKLIAACRRASNVPLMAYVDTRLGGDGSAYGAAGMKQQGDTGTRFWWTDFSSRFNRFSVRADKKRGMSQAEVALERRVVRIWGPPNLLFTDSL